MRAVWMNEFGPPDVLAAGEAADPVVGPGQALIEVAFANITFAETQFRATGFGPFARELPLIPGNGVGGVVVAVGAEADPALIGRRVVSSTGGQGGYAELAAVDADALFEVPDVLALDDAVALLADGRTAMMLLATAGVRAGERVLAEAAGGGVGTLLVQLARGAGARVVAAAGSDRKLEVARALGAERAVDYSRPNWTDAAWDGFGTVDVVFDGVGGGIGRAAFDLLAEGGRMVSFGRASGDWLKISDQEAAEQGVTIIRPQPTARDLRAYTVQALAAAATGRLRPVIGQRFPLDRAADAHAAIEARTTVGKTLLEVTALRPA